MRRRFSGKRTREGHLFDWTVRGGYCLLCGVKCVYNDDGEREYTLMNGTVVVKPAPECPFKDVSTRERKPAKKAKKSKKKQAKTG